MLSLIGIAYAAEQSSAPAAGPASFLGGQFGPLILMAATVVIFYFLLIRPQKKREKERNEMIAALKKGDRVVTLGGMYGVVDGFKEGDIVILKVSGTTKIEFTKSSIQGKVS